MKKTLFWCLVAMTPLASGQSINVDLGAEAGTPSSSYTGAGLAGYWNDGFSSDGENLRDISGNITEVSILLPIQFSMPIHDVNLTGDDLALLGDAMSGFGDVMSFIRFTGLQPGIYDLYAYGYAGGQPFEATLFEVQSYYQNLTGPFTGDLAEGVTHAHFFTQVPANGELRVGVVGGFWGSSGYVSGFQLVYNPCLADANRDGEVNFFDVAKFLSWFANNDFRADLNFDRILDFMDVQLFLQEFSTGCP